MEVYLHTYAERILVTVNSIRRLAVAINPNPTLLQGLGRYCTRALVGTIFGLQLDGVYLQVAALVTSCALAVGNVLLGIPFGSHNM